MINLLYMCIFGSHVIKRDIYNVMTSSRELANYCQESIKSIHSRKISDLLNNFHLKTSIDFAKRSLTDEDGSFFEFHDIDFDNNFESNNKITYIKVINYIETFLMEAMT